MKDALSICWEGRAAATAWRVAQRGLTVSHPDHRPTTWLCGGKSKAQRPIKGTKHCPGSQKSGVQTSATSSWLCDLGQVTFPFCPTGSSPLNWGVRTVPAAQGHCRNHKLGTWQLLILHHHLPMWMRTCPRSPAESGLSPAQSPFIQGSFLAVASEAVFHSLPAQQCREVHARPVLTFHLCWLYSKILTERLQGPG